MSDASILIIALITLVSFLFGFQNTVFVPSELRASGALSLRVSKLTAVLGLLSAALVEGNSMTKSLTVHLAPRASIYDGIVTLAVTAIFITSLKISRLSVPFSTIIVGSFLGSAVATSIPVNAPRAELIVVFWVLSPLLTGVISFLTYRAFLRIVRMLNVIRISEIEKAGTFVASFVVAYSLGANNIGLILGLGENFAPGNETIIFPILLAFMAALGVTLITEANAHQSMTNRLFLLSPKQVIVAFISGAIVVWIATRMQIPVWITPCIIGGFVGVVMGKEIHKANRILALQALFAWVMVPAAAFVLSYSLSIVI